jgi:predicted O-methyltransferase YrrM
MITIFCFAGRRGNMQIQLPYIHRILSEHPDVEYHVWNLARNNADREYVKTIEGERITVLEDPTRREGSREGCRCMYCSTGRSPFEAVYQYYTQEQFKDRLFVKIDDDIVFIETGGWPKFVDAIVDNPEHIVSAMVINNGACTSTIPGLWHDFEGLSVLAREAYKSLEYAEMSHSFMFGHWRELLHQPVELIVPDNYLSINMIGYNWEMGRQMADLLGTIPEPGAYDSVPEMPPEFANMKIGDEGAVNILPRYIVRGFLTAHLSFAPQYMPPDRETVLRKSYADISSRYLEMENDMIFPRIPSAVTHEEATKLVELASGGNVLELGAQYGFSTVVLAQVAKLVCSVDTHQGDVQAGFADTWDTFQGNLKSYGVTNVHPLRGKFEDILPQLAERAIMFDGVFIDGAHDKASVQRDLDLALPLIYPGGWVAFHDYGRGPHNGFHDFAVTEVADAFGIDGVVGCLAWGYVK